VFAVNEAGLASRLSDSSPLAPTACARGIPTPPVDTQLVITGSTDTVGAFNVSYHLSHETTVANFSTILGYQVSGCHSTLPTAPPHSTIAHATRLVLFRCSRLQIIVSDIVTAKTLAFWDTVSAANTWWYLSPSTCPCRPAKGAPGVQGGSVHPVHPFPAC
jgi:hypothetical protein